MLDRLVLPDRAVEHHALFCIVGRLAQRGAAEADRLGADQDALRIHAVQDVFEALALLADPVLHRHRQVVDEELVGIDGAAPHLRDFARVDVLAVEVRVEKTQALGAALDLLERRGAREDQHLGRDLRGRDPDFLSRHHIAVVAFAHRLGLELERLQSDVGLGDREARLVLPGDQRRQHAPLLLLVAEHHDGVEPEDVHVQRRGARHAGAELRDGLHQDRRLGDAEARAAVFLRDADAEPAVIGKGAMKVVREAAFLILAEPVIVAEPRADALDRIADRLLFGGKGKIHPGPRYPLILPRHARACRGHPRLSMLHSKSWMAGTSPAMTAVNAARGGGRSPKSRVLGLPKDDIFWSNRRKGGIAGRTA